MVIEHDEDRTLFLLENGSGLKVVMFLLQKSATGFKNEADGYYEVM